MVYNEGVMKPILERLKERVLLCDGAMGTMLQEVGLPDGACPEETVLKDPALIEDIHRQYVDAGAEIIETNTFGANRLKLSDYGLEESVVRINREAVCLARKAAEGRAYVAGSAGPLGRQIEPLGDLAFDDALEAYREQFRALAGGGADILFIETISDIREARAALMAAREVSDIPVVAHMTFEEGGRTFTGTPPDVAAVVLSSLGAAAVGANCGVGPEGILPSIERIAGSTRLFLSVIPNAGLPEIVDGRTVFRKSPESMAEYAAKFAALGVNIIGGCCGTTPAHTKAMAAALNKRRPVKRKVPPLMRLCGQGRIVTLSRAGSPLVIGERINLSVRKKMAKAFVGGDAAPLRRAAREQVEAGADLIDVNAGANAEALGVEGVSEKELMAKAVLVVQRCVDAPLVIDSSSPEAIEAGLKECGGRALINSVTAEKEKMLPLLTVARRHGAAIVVLPLSDKGIPETAAKRVKLAEEVRTKAVRMGIAPEDILVDPLVMTASAAQEQVAVTLETLSMLKERGYQTVIGLSNVSFGLPERSVLNAAFLAMAMGKGLDAVILNPADERVMRVLRAARVLTMADEGAGEFISSMTAAAPVAEAPAVPAGPAGSREDIARSLTEAIHAGDREGVVPLVEKALALDVPPLELNLSVITPALEEVGRRFESKEIFLPQMILSAETVQNAFGRLRKEMKDEKMPSRGTIIMATVRGDVHDIGKNICCTVLENYGYEIIDLGRNVPADVIADSAAESGAALVGLSALMTTTMKQMERVIAELKGRGLELKVMVGGAVVTPAFAESIGADGHARDAGEIVKLVKRLMGK